MTSYYSVVWCKNPRVVTTLDKDTRDKLPYLDRVASIHIYDRAKRVARALKNPDHINLTIGSINPSYIEGAIEPHLMGKRVEDLSPIERGRMPHAITLERRSNEVCVLDPTNVYICFTGAETIASLFVSTDPESWEIDHSIPTSMGMILSHPQSLYDMRGVFECELSNSVESHGFVLYITDTHITVYNTYGGLVEYYITRYKKDGWIDSFISFYSLDPQTQFDTYHILWGLPENHTKHVLQHPRQITFLSLHMGRVL
jgi:hypothetical protein